MGVRGSVGGTPSPPTPLPRQRVIDEGRVIAGGGEGREFCVRGNQVEFRRMRFCAIDRAFASVQNRFGRMLKPWEILDDVSFLNNSDTLRQCP